MNDAGAKVVITADGGWRSGTVVPLKANVDEALAELPTVEKVIVVRAHRADPVELKRRTRRRWWHELVADAAGRPAQPEPVDSEHPLFILYTSGIDREAEGRGPHHRRLRGRTPRCTTRWVFDLKDDDIYWCTADVGWVTGHSYVVYGPLMNGATGVMYEGAPDQPEPDRFWEIIERHKVTILYTAPTAIRAFMRWGEQSEASTTCRRCGCSARWASRSTPRRGCGTARSSAAGAARSSTPGGRPRPAAS